MDLKKGLLFILLLSTLPALGAEKKLSAIASYETFNYFKSLPAPTRTRDDIIHLEPTFDIKYNKRSRMTLKPHLRSNLSTDESPENYFLNLKEAYWEIKTNPARIRIGANTYSWGVMDGFSPLDVVNGRLLYNPLAADKRGAGAIDLQYEGRLFQVQGLYIPYQSPTLFPSTDSRWLPRDSIENVTSDKGTLLLPPTFNYNFPGTLGRNEALQNNYGFKISSRFDTIDVNAVYFEGSGITPQIGRLDVPGSVISTDPDIIQANGDVSVTPLYYRQRTVGANLVWAPSDVIIKFETSYGKSLNKARSVVPWLWQNALGIEKPVNTGWGSLTLITQGYYAENKDPIDNLTSSSSRLFDRAVVFGARLAVNERITYLFTSLYNYKDDSVYFHLDGEVKLYDRFKLKIGADSLQGGAKTLLGTYSANDRITTLLSYYW